MRSGNAATGPSVLARPRGAVEFVEYSSSDSIKSTAATFSSRCTTFEVPGIGNITGLRFSNHASAIWPGVA